MKFDEITEAELELSSDVEECIELSEIVDEYGSEKEMSGAELCFGCHSY